MHKLRTLNLPPHRGRDFFATIFVEPDPAESESFTVPDDAEQWGMSIHFQPDDPYESQVGVARIDTAHGEPHFDRLYEPTDNEKNGLARATRITTPKTTCFRTGERTLISTFRTTIAPNTERQ